MAESGSYGMTYESFGDSTGLFVFAFIGVSRSMCYIIISAHIVVKLLIEKSFL
jgi:hypothetical protein